MTRRWVLLAFPGAVLLAQQKKSKDKGPDVEVLEASAHVEEGRINIDGRLRNVSERPIRKPVIYFEMLDSDRKVLTRQQGPAGADELAPGEESAFQAQMAYHARVVWFRMEFEDGSGRELRAEKTGPFPIEQ